MHGFTCGIADLLITPEADEMRMSLVQQSEDLGMAAAFKCIARPAPVDRAMAREQLCREIRVSSGSVIFHFVVTTPTPPSDVCGPLLFCSAAHSNTGTSTSNGTGTSFFLDAMYATLALVSGSSRS